MLQRFYDVEACRRRFIMNRLGQLLRNFRRKVFVGYILPNQGNPKKLEKIPRTYRTMVEQTDWDNFVAYTQSDEFKVLINYSNVHHYFTFNDFLLKSYNLTFYL